MPMPHAEMKRLIQRRLRGTDGAERLKVARECMAMLPGYKQGPYADLRKWLTREMETTRKRREVRHADGTFVPREGDARIVLLGPPNAGKSSLLKGLCGSSVKVGDYAFTTLRPIAATAVINEARIQLVEIPGLIEGAREDRGSGRMYLAAAQDADGYLVVMPLEDSSGFERFLEEIQHILEGKSSPLLQQGRFARCRCDSGSGSRTLRFRRYHRCSGIHCDRERSRCVGRLVDYDRAHEDIQRSVTY